MLDKLFAGEPLGLSWRSDGGVWWNPPLAGLAPTFSQMGCSTSGGRTVANPECLVGGPRRGRMQQTRAGGPVPRGEKGRPGVLSNKRPGDERLASPADSDRPLDEE